MRIFQTLDREIFAIKTESRILTAHYFTNSSKATDAIDGAVPLAIMAGVESFIRRLVYTGDNKEIELETIAAHINAAGEKSIFIHYTSQLFGLMKRTLEEEEERYDWRRWFRLRVENGEVLAVGFFDIEDFFNGAQIIPIEKAIEQVPAYKEQKEEMLRAVKEYLSTL